MSTRQPNLQHHGPDAARPDSHKAGHQRSVAARATVFAALGDETRLALLGRLWSGQRCSISQLTEGTKLTRQAVTKHLHVLERARMVHVTRSGRESLVAFNPQPVLDMKDFLETVSRHWDAALNRLKTFVEGNPES
jgi:DNA-binding transcriptional ArsR family regulator